MATSYKTPGVYVEEIPKLPPSVAQVETAIPAFIGCTEKASRNGQDLTEKVVYIESLAEYVAWYGEGPAATYTAYLEASADRVTAVRSSMPYLVYDALRMFFDNGGGRCAIVSVGPYASNGAVDLTTLKKGLAALETADEPTLIVCPDAVRLSGNGLYDFNAQALAQAAKLGDRFVICDTLPSDEATANTFAARVQEFRDKIGISNLKYGAAYGPYIRSSIPRAIRYRELTLRRGDAPAEGSPEPPVVALESLTSDNALLQLVYDVKNAKSMVDKLSAIPRNSGPTGILSGTNKSFEDEFRTKLNDVSTAADEPARIVAIRAVYAFAAKLMASLHAPKDELPTKVGSLPVPANPAQTVSFVLKDEFAGIASTTGAVDAFKTLAKHSNEFTGGLFSGDPAVANNDLGKAVNLLGIADYAAQTDAALDAFYGGAATAAEKNESARKAIASGLGVLLRFWYAIQTAALAYERTLDGSLESSMGTYKQIKATVAASASVVPPSGAIAGVYARVDSARGVWKAPANESINSVLGPVVQITAEQQAGLNVDPVAGKSINAIRSFTGKGTLVWGARTLAGNDNEWRYVNVRRFFNMVEESSKKATESFVFDSNDANTWIKVQGMLENFLTVLWRQGALQGAKPEHAFYVAVGLGKTMTSLDILEGRMIVEIGMAAVRPAEFIVLRFSHKLAES